MAEAMAKEPPCRGLGVLSLFAVAQPAPCAPQVLAEGGIGQETGPGDRAGRWARARAERRDEKGATPPTCAGAVLRS